jgi:hypothetical protein
MDADIYDIMPTVLYLMGQVVPGDVDDQVLTEVIDEDFVKSNKAKFEKADRPSYSGTTSLSSTGKEELEKKLRSLGYLSWGGL